MAERGARRAKCIGIPQRLLATRQVRVLSLSLAPSLRVSRLACRCVLWGHPGWSPRRGSAILRSHGLSGLTGLNQRLVWRSEACLGWPGWERWELRLGSVRRKLRRRDIGQKRLGAKRLGPRTRHRRVMSATMSRPRRASPVGVFSGGGTGHRPVRGTASRFACWNVNRPLWRVSDRNSVLVTSERKVVRQFDRWGKTFLADHNRMVEAGL